MVEFHSGQVIKNYKELCGYFGFSPTKGKGREYHIREFERYCTYHKEGNKLIIDEVFSVPKDKIDNRVNNGGNIANTKYGAFMDDIVIDLLQQNGLIIVASFTDMFKSYVPLITDEYTRGKINGFGYLRDKHDMSIGLINTYSNKMKDMIKGSFETSLNRLAKQRVLCWSKEYVINTYHNGQDFATEDEMSLIKKYETDAYEELNIKPYERIKQDTNKKFKAYVIQGLKKSDADIFSYWNVYNIQGEDIITQMPSKQPDLKGLTDKYVNSIHEKILNYVIKPKDGEPYQPYKAEKHIKHMLSLDLLFWQHCDILESNEKEVEKPTNTYAAEELCLPF